MMDDGWWMMDWWREEAFEWGAGLFLIFDFRSRLGLETKWVTK